MENIQLLEKQDISQCAAIVNLNYNNKFKQIISARLQEMFSNAYGRSKPTFVTLKIGATVLALGGFAESQFNSGTYEIFLINTHPNFQGKGFGKKVMLALLNTIAERCEPEFWIVLNCKLELVDFYKQFGFHAVTTRKEGNQVMMTMNTSYLSRNLKDFKTQNTEEWQY